MSGESEPARPYLKVVLAVVLSMIVGIVLVAVAASWL
jgi:hypothetical protein